MQCNAMYVVYGTVWCGMVWYGMACHVMARYGTAFCDFGPWYPHPKHQVCFVSAGYGMVRYIMYICPCVQYIFVN